MKSSSFVQRICLNVLNVVVASVALTCPSARCDAAEPAQTDVFVSGTGGYHTYRIPSLLVTQRGTLLAFCEGRKTGRGDHGNLDLVLRRSTDNGESWEPMQLVYEEGGDEEITIGNPCPVVDQSTGRIWLPFCRDNDDVLITYSDDDGRTWEPPREITQSVKRPDWGWYATGPGVGIQLAAEPHRGRLVIPCDHREMIGDRSAKFSHVFYSDDQGQTWQLGGTVAPHTDECQVVELSDGRLLINMRNYSGTEGGDPEKGGMRAVAESNDGGQSWSTLHFAETLVEPICQASLIRVDAVRTGGPNHLLFSNPASKTIRHRLTVRLSRDGGQSWPITRLLHEGPAAYSCLAMLPDRSAGCLYESGRDHPYEKIMFERFTLEWLTTDDSTKD